MSDFNSVLAELIQAIRHEADHLHAQLAACTSQNSRLREQNYRLFTHIMELDQSNRQLQEQAFTDSMTGINNFRAFREQIESAFSLARRHNLELSLILMDIDRFKHFNDTYGHPAGDARLRRLARLLQQHVRQSDFVARYGGEEFVIILPATDAEGALRQAERLRQTIEKSAGETGNPATATEAQSVPLTGSFGVSTLRAETGSADALIDEADIALYAAKQSGRNSALHFDMLALTQRASTLRSRQNEERQWGQ